MTLTQQEFTALCASHGFGAHAGVLLPWLRPRVGFSRRAEADAPIGASRIGGGPDVPAGFTWPTHKGRPLDFLLQINLADVQGLQCGLDLPAQGVLSFFYDTDTQPWGYDPADRGGHGVRLFDADGLQRSPAPERRPRWHRPRWRSISPGACRIRFRPRASRWRRGCVTRG